MSQPALFQIPKEAVSEAFEKAKTTKVVGVDGQTIQDFVLNRTKLLDELWEQLSSGQYDPSPVRRVYIRKKAGGWRPLGIPTVKDYIVQTMLLNELHPVLEAVSHPNAYGHKRSKSGRNQAKEMVRQRCRQLNWALVLDIRQFGDNIDHQMLMSMVKQHIRTDWVLQYLERMMNAPALKKDGTLLFNKKGLSHGNKLNFLLGNYYLHHIFDTWMQKNHRNIPFERYNDDIICHCNSEAEAKSLLARVQKRFQEFDLETHPQKTKIVYCKDAARKGTYSNVSFDFLGFNFSSRSIASKAGKRLSLFGPGPIPSKPLQSKPVQSKPVQSKPVRSKPVQSKPAQSKTMRSKPER